MKLWAKLRIEDVEASAALIQQFFKCFNPNSTIHIEDDVAALSIDFDKSVPEGLLDAIGSCPVIQFHYSRELNHQAETEPAAAGEEVEAKTEPAAAGEEVEAKTEPAAAGEEAEAKTDTVAAGEEIETETEPVAAGEEVEAETKPAAAGEEVEAETEPVAADEEVETETEPIGAGEEVEAETEPAAVGEKVEPVTKPNVPGEEVETATETGEKKSLQGHPDLDAIAQKSSFYEDFVRNVADGLSLGKRTELFISIVEAVRLLHTCSWKGIETKLSQMGISFSNTDKLMLTTAVAKKFKETQNPLSILALIKVLVTYQNYDFHEMPAPKKPEKKDAMLAAMPEESEKVTVPITSGMSETEESKPNESQAESKSAMAMELPCMMGNPHIAEALAKVNMQNSIEDRVTCVLSSMGLEDQEYSVQQKILEIAYSAMRLKQITAERIRVNSFFSGNKEFLQARMNFSTFLNDFAKKQIGVVDFLCDLQRAIIRENEKTRT